jgi:alkylhydroperoxidase/carboxymuconolactone decarboxylase family protein YurZ
LNSGNELLAENTFQNEAAKHAMNKPLPTLDDLERRYRDMIGLVPPKIAKRLKLGLQVDPGIVTALEDWRIAALTPQALDQKTVQLMSFAILLVQTSDAAANHARAAIKAGATLQELHAAAAIATLFRGVAAFNLAGEILGAQFPEGGE